jgi:hypothetical protein
LAIEYQKEMEGLIEEQEKAVQVFRVEWAQLLEEVREATGMKEVREEDRLKAGVVDSRRMVGFAGEQGEEEEEEEDITV